MSRIKKFKYPLPDFLGIGGARCGSTWLHNNLSRHPDLWLPPTKEIHYFSRSISYPSPSYLATDRPHLRLFGRQKHHREYRRLLARALSSNLRRFDWGRFLWNIKYFFGNYNDQWYASLFKEGIGKIKGEITPAYSMLASKDVAHIRSIMPQAKIIFLIRNPIYRSWSGIRYQGASSLPFEKLSKILENPGMVLRSDYIRTISIWQKHFPKSQLFIGFFDEIETNPETFLLKIYEFLGIKSSKKYIGKSVYQKVNIAPGKTVPEELKIYLARKHLLQIKELSELIGGHALDWLAEAKRILNSV